MMILTEENFITAFWHLYEDKPIEKISIRELCLTAGYNRTTFYAHFENIYDLLNRAILQLLEQIDLSKDELLQNFINQPDKLLPDFLKLFKENQQKIQLLIERGQHYLLENLIKKHILQVFDSLVSINQTVSYALEYHISAILGVIKHWFTAHQDLSEEELLALLYDIAQNGVLNQLHHHIKKSEIL